MDFELGLPRCVCLPRPDARAYWDELLTERLASHFGSVRCLASFPWDGCVARDLACRIVQGISLQGQSYERLYRLHVLDYLDQV